MAIQPLNDAPAKPRRRPPKRASQRQEEGRLVEALRRRDDEVCRRLIGRHHAAMVRVARTYVASEAVAEEVAQEAWVAMFRGLDSFQARSSLKTWLFSILIRRARSVGALEWRTEAVSQLVSEDEDESDDPTETFFYGEAHPEAGSWALPPLRWRRSPEASALDAEATSLVEEAIARLPEVQRVVVTLRDVEGWKTAEIAQLLERTPNWVRVTLHRGRFKVRSEVEKKLGVKE